MATDPFTLVYNGIWECLERKDYFTDLVEEKNRIKLTDQGPLRRPTKDEITEVDVPEVMLITSTTRYWEMRASGGASINKVYTILLTSGERLLDTGKFFPVQWAVSRAMYDYRDILLNLEYGDPAEKFVQKTEMPSVEEGLSEEEMNRSLKGWAAIWQCDVTMWFSNTILRGV